MNRWKGEQIRLLQSAAEARCGGEGDDRESESASEAAARLHRGSIADGVALARALRRRRVRVLLHIDGAGDAATERECLVAETLPFLQLLAATAGVELPPPLELDLCWCRAALASAGAAAEDAAGEGVRVRAAQHVRAVRLALRTLTLEPEAWRSALPRPAPTQRTAALAAAVGGGGVPDHEPFTAAVLFIGTRRGDRPFAHAPPATLPRTELERTVARLGQLHHQRLAAIRQRRRERTGAAGDGGGGGDGAEVDDGEEEKSRELRAAELLASWYRLDRNARPVPLYILSDRPLRQPQAAAVATAAAEAAAVAASTGAGAGVGAAAGTVLEAERQALEHDRAALRDMGWGLRAAAASMRADFTSAGAAKGSGAGDGEPTPAATPTATTSTTSSRWQQRCLEPHGHQLLRALLRAHATDTSARAAAGGGTRAASAGAQAHSRALVVQPGRSSFLLLERAFDAVAPAAAAPGSAAAEALHRHLDGFAEGTGTGDSGGGGVDAHVDGEADARGELARLKVELLRALGRAGAHGAHGTAGVRPGAGSQLPAAGSDTDADASAGPPRRLPAVLLHNLFADITKRVDGSSEANSDGGGAPLPRMA
eukprot:g552.t1